MADLERGHDMKKGKRLDPLFQYGCVSNERDNYKLLRTAILSQAITDYTAAAKAIAHGSSSESWMRHWRSMRKECMEFFAAPIYDFEDVDTRKVLKMLDEAIKEDLCVS